MAKDKANGTATATKTKIVCVDENIAVRPDKIDEFTKGGIALPDSAREDKSAMKTGRVVSVGKGKQNDNGTRQEMPCAVGDRIIYTAAPYTGGRFECNGGEVVDLIGAACVYAVLEDE